MIGQESKGQRTRFGKRKDYTYCWRRHLASTVTLTESRVASQLLASKPEEIEAWGTQTWESESAVKRWARLPPSCGCQLGQVDGFLA
jgi:hypothetical protein